MKVGILTHHWLPNFGANLQALATVETLRRLGHDPVIVDYRIRAIQERYEARTQADQVEAHERFVLDNLPITKTCYNLDGVSSAVEQLKLDCMLSGSDAVLRLDSKTKRDDLCFPNPFWLTWAKDLGICRTGFLAASSMGSNYLREDKQTRLGIATALRQLNYCGVRDAWTKAMLKCCSPLSSKIHFCPDPVSNFATAVPAALTPRINLPDKPYILVGLYSGMMSDEWQERLTELANRAGLLTIGLPQPDSPVDGHFNMNLELPMDPLTWYAWIVSSSGYVGVRFHPVMIAISKAIPVVPLDDYDNEAIMSQAPFKSARRFRRLLGNFPRRASKTYDLCRRVGLERYSISRNRFGEITPLSVLESIQRQRNHPVDTSKIAALSLQFRTAVAKIVGP